MRCPSFSLIENPSTSSIVNTQKGAEQSDRARFKMRRQRVAEPPRFKAERREALEAAEQVLKIRPEGAGDEKKKR